MESQKINQNNNYDSDSSYDSSSDDSSSDEEYEMSEQWKWCINTRIGALTKEETEKADEAELERLFYEREEQEMEEEREAEKDKMFADAMDEYYLKKEIKKEIKNLIGVYGISRKIISYL